MSTDGSMRLVRTVRRAGRIVLAFALCALSACGSASPRTVHYGTYVSQLCEAIGPFDRDAQRFGRMLGTYGPGAGSRRSEQAMANILTAVIADSRHVVTTLDAVGAPDVSNGRALAAGTVATFDQIGQSDAEWRSELRTRDWAWATMSRVKRERLRISIQELLLVGRQFERLPLTQERQNAMASSPVCREVFGSVRVGGQQSNRSGLAELYRKRHPRAESLYARAG